MHSFVNYVNCISGIMLYTCILYSLPDYISHSEKIWHTMIVHGKAIVEHHVIIACIAPYTLDSTDVCV